MPALHQSRFHLAEHKRPVYVVHPEHGTTIEEMETSEYWAHVAAKLLPNTRIEAFAEDGSWLAFFHVVMASKNFAKVVLLQKFDLDASEIPAEIDTSGHKVEWAGPHSQFRVIRLGKTPVENVTLRDKLYPRAEAVKWLTDHLAVVQKPSPKRAA